MDSTTIVRDPAIRQLQEENDRLREEQARLLVEIHDLEHSVKPHLLALFQSRIGPWELKRLHAQCQTALLRRTLDLIRASLNRGEEPDLPAVESRIKEEFLHWQEQIRTAAEVIRKSEHRLSHLLTPEADRNLKTLYRRLVRRLHPDLHPDFTEKEKRLWQRILDSYERSDLEELQALSILTEKDRTDSLPSTSIETLCSEKENLQDHIHRLLKEIEQRESQPPFTLRTCLEDADWVANRRTELEQETADLEMRHAILKEELEILIAGLNREPGISIH